MVKGDNELLKESKTRSLVLKADSDATVNTGRGGQKTVKLNLPDQSVRIVRPSIHP